MEMTPQRWSRTNEYLREVFGRVEHEDRDEQLATLMSRAVAAGLPDIAISPEVGRFLKVLTMLATRGPNSRGVALELGTLAGYSGIWLARGLPESARLITVEYNPRHAAFARAEFVTAGVSDKTEIIIGAALDVLPRLRNQLGDYSLDLAFIDAVKTEYPRYFELLKPMIRPGGLLIADNALGSTWWIDDPKGSDPQRDAVDSFNRAVASDKSFEASCVPIRQGILVATRRDGPAG